MDMAFTTKRHTSRSPTIEKESMMNVLMALLLWSVLFVLCWPLAFLVLILWPVVWLISLPFKLIGFTVSSVFALVIFLFCLPFKIIGSLFGANPSSSKKHSFA